MVAQRKKGREKSGEVQNKFGLKRRVEIKGNVVFYFILIWSFKKRHRNFPDGPVAKTLASQCKGLVFNPWSGN